MTIILLARGTRLSRGCFERSIVRMAKSVKNWRFTFVVSRYGDTPEEAWQHAADPIKRDWKRFRSLRGVTEITRDKEGDKVAGWESDAGRDSAGGSGSNAN